MIKARLTFFACSCLLLSIICVAGQECSREDDSRCFDETCATELSTTKSVAVPCVCGGDNIGVKFSDCDATNTTRSLTYFWKPPATCLNGTLPQPIRGVPCNLTCSEGTYLNVTYNFACQQCQPGTFSAGGGKKWTNWNYLPAQFTTYCTASNPLKYCRSWSMNGDTADSGNNYGYDSLESVLELRVKLVRSGFVKFEYKSSAEQNYDGLQFWMDGLRIFFKSNTDWVQYNTTLTAGYHTIQWRYYKDRSITDGEDKVYIKMIQAQGTTYAITECEPCDVGFYSSGWGASECLPCPSDTYNANIAATTCKPCQSGTYSFPGSTKCIPSRACNNATSSPDITFNETICVNGHKLRSYQWIEPMTCNGAQNLTLPPSVNISCAPEPCPAGTQSNNQGECNYCPVGTSSDGTTACVECTAGQRASDRILNTNKWQSPSWPQGFSSSCSGTNCLTNGWRFGEWFTDSGTGHGRDSTSSLTLSINAFNGSTVQFNYSLQCQSEDSVLLFVDNILVKEYQCSTSICNAPFAVDSFFLMDYEVDDVFQNTIYRQLHPYSPPKNRTFTVQWSYVKRSDATNTSCDRIVISSIQVTGIAVGQGGSASCQACPAGTYSQPKESQCSLCNIGESSNMEKTQCTSCLMNYFADVEGTPECMACGTPTWSSSNRSSCEYNCSFVMMENPATNTSRTYNLSPIGQFNVTYLGNFSEGTEYRFFGNLCEWNPLCAYSDGNINAYVCQKNFSLVTNLGKVVSFKEINYTSSANLSLPALLYNFTLGDTKNGKECSTTLTLFCDPSSSTTSPSVSSSFSTAYLSFCSFELLWATKYACPLCTANDYGASYSDCTGESQTVTFYQLNSYCYGGVPLPTAFNQACEEKVTVKTTTLIVVTVVGSIALGGALAGLGFLYHRHRKLYASYSQLRMNVPLEESDEPEPQFKALDDDN